MAMAPRAAPGTAGPPSSFKPLVILEEGASASPESASAFFVMRAAAVE